VAAQDVAEIIPRVRRAIEGPVPLAPSDALTDTQLLAWTADAIGDIILITVGKWPHSLVVTERDTDTNVPTAWGVDPGLDPQEEGVVAAQAAIQFFFHQVKDMKVSERIVNEGQQWEWAKSATLLRDQIKLLTDQRNAMLEGLLEKFPVLARYASILEVRDRLGATLLEPWSRTGGLGGGQEQAPNTWLPGG
jgi:hypothetical protein